jgi:hypothetical protein
MANKKVRLLTGLFYLLHQHVSAVGFFMICQELRQPYIG